MITQTYNKTLDIPEDYLNNEEDYQDIIQELEHQVLIDRLNGSNNE